MSVKGIVFNARKNRYAEISRFRIGDINQQLTSVDVEEVVRSGGYFVEMLESFKCDNLEFNPLKNFIIDKRSKFKEEN